jgi:hypothetical protein
MIKSILYISINPLRKITMPGIYLLLSDSKTKDAVLKPTEIGPSHITLAHTGKNLTTQQLAELVPEIARDWMGKSIFLTQPRINTFFHERKGKERYDLLIDTTEETQEEIRETREKYLVSRFPELYTTFNMRVPHVTARIYWNKESVHEAFKQVADYVPLAVTVTGIALDF